MKLTFKDMTTIYTALTEKANRVANELKWHEDWAKEHEADEDHETIELRAELSTINAIIKRFETSEV